MEEATMSKVTDFFKRPSNDELEDLDSGYDSDYYTGAYVEEEHKSRDDEYDNGDDDGYGNRGVDRGGKTGVRKGDRDLYTNRGSQRTSGRGRDEYEDSSNDGGYYPGPSAAGNGRGSYTSPDGRRTGGTGTGTSPRSTSYRPEGTRAGQTGDRYAAPDSGKDVRRPVIVAEPEPEPVEVETLYFTPTSGQDNREDMVDGMIDGHVVVVSVAKLDVPEVVRLSDYIKGAVYALEGSLFRLDKTTVVMVPKGVEVDPDTLDFPEEDAGEEDDYGEYDDEYSYSDRDDPEDRN
jgi:FtsZ-interacting cell division protein YlmF